MTEISNCSHESITKAANSFPFISAPSAPRKRKRPMYNILQYLEGYETKSAKTEAYYPETSYAHFKLVFFEAIEVLAGSIKERFAQPAFKFLSEVKQLLLNSIKKEPVNEEMKVVNQKFAGDFNKESLPIELELLPVIFEGKSPVNIKDIVDVVKSLSNDRPTQNDRKRCHYHKISFDNGSNISNSRKVIFIHEAVKNLATFDNEPKEIQFFNHPE